MSAEQGLIAQGDEKISASPSKGLDSDIDPCRYLIGSWKRSLDWRQFGGSFKRLRGTNAVVCIEEYASSVQSGSARYLKWSFGKSLKPADLRFGYVMKFENPSDGDGRAMRDSAIEWQYCGHLCTGIFQHHTSVFVLNFQLKTKVVVVTYRIIDANKMAVCIVEVDGRHTPSVQLGNMYRLDVSAYAAHASGKLEAEALDAKDTAD